MAKKEMRYVEKKNVTFVGFNKLDPADQKQIKDIIYKDFVTLERELKQIHGLKLHFKEKKVGGRKKYSAHLIIEAETGPITVSKTSSNVQWDAVATVHDLMDKARQRIIHIYKTDSNFRKDYEKGAL